MTNLKSSPVVHILAKGVVSSFRGVINSVEGHSGAWGRGEILHSTEG